MSGAVPQLRFKGFEGAWKKSRLGQYCEKVGSGATPRGGAESYLPTGIPLIRSQNVRENWLELSDVAFISQQTHERMRGSWVFPDDVLLNITGASIGRSCVVPETVGEANVNQHVCIIRTIVDICSEFLQLFLASERGQKERLNSH